MKRIHALLVVMVIMVAVGATTTLTLAQGPTGTGPALAPLASPGTAFTYQGQLRNGAGVVNSTCDLEFGLWDALTLGTQVGVTQTKSAITVTNGLFSTPLDFGASAINGEARSLAMTVRCPAGAGSYSPLTPRQPLTPAPLALALPGLYTQLNATSPNIIGGYSGNTVAPGVSGATIAGGGGLYNLNRVNAARATIGGGWGNTAGGDGGTISGGAGNSIPITGTQAVIGGGGGNTASNWGATVAGGSGNISSAFYASVSGGYQNTSSYNYASIGGGIGNTASGWAATVAGGSGNTSSAYYATVSGGANNKASNENTSVGGGIGNTASGWSATVGGGTANTASDIFGTVAGGNGNTAGGADATISGGASNIASSAYATVPGGYLNAALGPFSLAAGNRAKANHAGAFVWGDSTTADIASSADNQFIVRASGGVGINTNSTTGNGLTVNGQIIAGGVGVNPGSTESFVSRGALSGISLDDRANSSLRWVIYPQNGALRFFNGADRVAIESDGSLTLTALGAAGGSPLCRNPSGQIAYCSSSLRYKNNVAALNMGLGTLAQLRPVTFDWKETGQPDLGFVAEEVDQVAPLLTTRNADGQIEGVKYDRISAVLVKAVQEQQQQIAALTAENAALDEKTSHLEARLTALEQQVGGANPTANPQTMMLGLGGLVTLGVALRGRRERGGAR
jgi:hypothetical protein